MANKLDTFVADCRTALKSQPGTPGREKVRDLVKQVLSDPDFIATYIPDGTPERHVLYEDPELGLHHSGAWPHRRQRLQAPRSRSLLGNLWPGRRRDDHDGVGLRRASHRDDPGPGEIQSRLRDEARRRVSL